MTQDEALAALRAGKRVRCSDWEPGEHMLLIGPLRCPLVIRTVRLADTIPNKADLESLADGYRRTKAGWSPNEQIVLLGPSDAPLVARYAPLDEAEMWPAVDEGVVFELYDPGYSAALSSEAADRG